MPTTAVDLSSLRDILVTLVCALISGGVPILLIWLRAHMSIMQDAAMNTAITASAERFAALLVKSVQEQGLSLTSVNVRNAQLASMANNLIANYPQFSASLGLTPDKAANVILGEAAKLINGASVVEIPATTVTLKETTHV